MFGDNESVVNSSNIATGKLHALSWHRVREPPIVAAKLLHFFHIVPGAINPLTC